MRVTDRPNPALRSAVCRRGVNKPKKSQYQKCSTCDMMLMCGQVPLRNSGRPWTYDAALNRTDSVVDDLNRTTSIGGVATTCDILGNRLTMGSNSYGWDCLNRMISYDSDSYVYRADGMRIGKTVAATASFYRYDGQLGIEDLDVTGSRTTVNDYGLGARGVDYFARTTGSTTTAGFPLYDSHGSMITCLFRSGSGASSSYLLVL